jgi:hypothetical protein
VRFFRCRRSAPTHPAPISERELKRVFGGKDAHGNTAAKADGCSNDAMDIQAGENNGNEWWRVDANLGFVRLCGCKTRLLGKGDRKMQKKILESRKQFSS